MGYLRDSEGIVMEHGRDEIGIPRQNVKWEWNKIGALKPKSSSNKVGMMVQEMYGIWMKGSKTARGRSF